MSKQKSDRNEKFNKAQKEIKYKKKILLFEATSLKFKIFSFLIFLLIAIIISILGFYNFFCAVFIFFALCLVFVYGFLIFLDYNRNRLLFINQLIHNFDVKNRHSFYRFPLPVLACSGSGIVLWYNEKLEESLNLESNFVGVNFSNYIKQPLSKFCVEGGANLEQNRKNFKVYGSYFQKSNVFIFLFEEITEFVALRQKFFLSEVCVLYIAIDNYRETLTNKKDGEKSAIVGIIDNLLEGFVEEHEGILQKYREDEFFVVVKKKGLKEMVAGKFKILEIIKNGIKSQKKCELTISIGVGSEGENFAECKKLALQALDMALGRGGDQAVVKTPSSIKFYGGNSKELYKSSRVKARVVARALLELVRSSSNVVLMGHKFGDLDSCGAAVGLALAIRKLQKSSVVLVDRRRNLSKILFEKIEEAGYNDLVVDLDSVMDFVTPETLLIITDTHSLNLLESRELYEACRNVVVIDHHRKAVDCVGSAVIFYHEPYASSTCELVCELIQQFGQEKLIGPVEAQVLLAGIMLDTKNFSIKVGVRTFEAAAYLKLMGADTVEVKKMFSNSLVSYNKKTKIVAGSEIYRNCAIAISEFNTADMRVIAPQAADELLSISGVEAAFVLFELDDEIFITARSLGKFNVQVIMESLKGGGHQLQAACQLEGVEIQEAKAKLIGAIDEWLS